MNDIKTRRFAYIYEVQDPIETLDKTVALKTAFEGTDEKTKNPNETTVVEVFAFAICRSSNAKDLGVSNEHMIIVPDSVSYEQGINAAVQVLPQDTFGLIFEPRHELTSEFLSDRIKTILNRSIIGACGYISQKAPEPVVAEIRDLLVNNLKITEQNFETRCFLPDGSLSTISLQGMATSMLAWKSVGGIPVRMQDPIAGFSAVIQAMGYIIAHRPPVNL